MTDLSHLSPAELVALLPTPEAVANPYPIYERLRESTPVFGYRDYPPGTVPGQDEPVTSWVLMRHADVTAAARDHDTFSSRDPLQERSSAPTLMLVNHDNPEHDRLRRVVNAVFSRRSVTALKPWMLERIAECMDELGGGEIEAVSTIASTIPARVMMRVLGCPDSDSARCRGWATAFMLSADLTPAQREASNREMFGYFTSAVADVRSRLDAGADAPPGLVSDLLAAEVEGVRLSVEEVIRFCVTLVVAGSETTTFLLANLLHGLATMPDVRNRLLVDRRLVPAFLDESLRHGGPPQRLFRIATRDVEIGGRRIGQGDWVALFFAAANHDPSVFPDPGRFDLGRRNAGQHLTMGLGIHQCLGFAVARTEAEALVEVVLDRHPSLKLGATPPVPQTASLLTHGFDALHLHLGA